MSRVVFLNKLRVNSLGSRSMVNTDTLTAKQAAAYLRITTRTLYKLVQAGLVPASRVGINWRFSRAALEKYVRATASQQIDKHKG